MPPTPRPFVSVSGVGTTPQAQPGNAPGAATTGVQLPPLDQMRARLLAAIPIGDEVLRELAAQRAAAIQRALLADGKVEAERVTMVERALEKGARVELSLK